MATQYYVKGAGFDRMLDHHVLARLVSDPLSWLNLVVMISGGPPARMTIKSKSDRVEVTVTMEPEDQNK